MILDRHLGQVVAEMPVDPSEKGGTQLRFIRLAAGFDLGGDEVLDALQVDRAGELGVHPMGRIAPLAPVRLKVPRPFLRMSSCLRMMES